MAHKSALQTLLPGMNKNIALLMASLAFGQAVMVALIATATLAAQYITNDNASAFYPTTLQFVGMLVFTTPVAYMMKWLGRRWGLTLGALVGICSALLSVYAIFSANFVLLCIGGFFFSIQSVVVNQIRFAAVEAAEPGQQANAVSYVLIGGIAAALMGPQLGTWSVDLFEPIMFAGTYAVLACLVTVSMILVQFTDIKKPEEKATDGPSRSLWQLLTIPRFFVAMMAAALGYGTMNFMMLPTPIAMQLCGYSSEAGGWVITGHVLGMFAPSLVTGRLINRFGVEKIVAVGGALLTISAIIALSGLSYGHFMIGLIILGVGWNFAFIGGTTMLASVYKPQERAKAQSLNDFCVFSLVALSALTTGQVLDASGWSTVVTIVIPAGLIVFTLVVLLIAFGNKPVGPQAGTA